LRRRRMGHVQERKLYGARHRIRTANETYDQIAGDESGAGRSIDHFGKRLVPENQPLAIGWSGSVLAIENFSIGTADPDRERPRQNISVTRQLGDLAQPT
jgi:hypothetical protein